MIISRPRKSDAALVCIGIVIFILLMLGVVFVVRRQPEGPHQMPAKKGMAMAVDCPVPDGGVPSPHTRHLGHPATLA